MGRRGRKAIVTTIMSRDRAKAGEPENYMGAPNPQEDTEREGTREVGGARLDAHKAADAR